MIDLSKLKSGSDIRGVALGESAVLTPELAARCARSISAAIRACPARPS